MHLLVCYLNELQNARCNDKDLQEYFVYQHVNSESRSLLAKSFSEELGPPKDTVGSETVRVDIEEISIMFFFCFLVILT